MDRYAALRALQGKRIKHAIVLEPEGQRAMPILVMDDGSHVEFWADAEGNGPGHAEVVPALHRTLLRREGR